MSQKQDYYQTLGVGKSASGDEIKKSYRKLAMKYHPDRNPGDATAEKKFKEATEAYEILKDDQKKRPMINMVTVPLSRVGERALEVLMILAIFLVILVIFLVILEAVEVEGRGVQILEGLI